MSYINNLHPTEPAPLYRVIEMCIEKSIALWGKTVSVSAHEGKPRIESGMPQYDFPKGREISPDFTPDENDKEDFWELEGCFSLKKMILDETKKINITISLHIYIYIPRKGPRA